MTKIKINVTAEDICFGKKRNSGKCPVAFALHRVFPKARVYITKEKGTTWFAKCGKKSCLDAPCSVGRFVKRFDAGKPVQPFSFFITI